MLGEPQWQWLETELKKPAKLRIIVSGTPIIDGDHSADTWAAYLHERDRLFRLLHETKAEGTILVSGDRHRGGIAVVDGPIEPPLVDVSACGIADGKEARRFFPGRPEVRGSSEEGSCFGCIRIDWERPEIGIELEVRNDAGKMTVHQTLTRKMLTGNPTLPAVWGAVGEALGKYAPAEVEPSAALKIDGKAVTPKQIGEMVGKEITLDMKVAGTGKTKAGTMIFLNSADRKSPENFTVVIDMKGIESLKKAGIADPATSYKSQTVRVVGVVTSFQDRHEIIVSDAAKIKLVEK
jgi:alkaline phosphatase D